MDAGKCQIYRDFESLSSFREEWDRLVLDQTGDIHQTFDWCRVWWKYYGSGRRLAVLIYRVGDRLAGILPFGIDPVYAGVGCLNVAKLLNSEYTACVLFPAISGDHAHDFFDKALEILLDEEKCDLVSLGPVSDEFPFYEGVKRSARQRLGEESILREKSSPVYCLFRLPDSSEEYFASLKSKQRTNVRRRRKQIEERCGPLAVANLESWEEIRSEFPFFREMHDQYWLSRGQGGHFVDLVNGEDFSLDLIRTAAEDGRVCLQKMTAGGETVAYQFLFFFGTRVHWRLTARAIGEEWDKLGVGVLALLFLIENSIERGMKSIEAGPGIYEYKTQMGAEYLQMRSMLIGKPNSPGLQSKIKMLSWIYKSIDVVYYKIWYQRVVKVLGMNRGSIWQYYLRCRL